MTCLTNEHSYHWKILTINHDHLFQLALQQPNESGILFILIFPNEGSEAMKG